MYRRYNRYQSKPQVRSITVKYAGNCACCGGLISVGSIADYYSIACSEVLKKKQQDKGLNDYAGDGLDSRYEDSCKDACGL